MRRLVFAACAIVAGARLEAQAPDWSRIEIKAEKVAGNVYMLSGSGGFSGGNIGVSVGPDGVALIDDKFEPLVPKIEAALKGISDKPVRFVINTHYHGDHTHGNKAYGLRATVIAQENVRKRVAESDDFDDQPGTKAPPQALPLITFDHKLSLYLNGEEIRGLHFPAGHTDGDTVVFFTGSNVVHMGDDFFNGLFPFIDLEGGGSVPGYVAAVEAVLAQLPPGVRIIPGHGPLATRADLEVNLAMLKETSAVVQKGLSAGQTAEQMKAAKVLAKWDKYSWDFISTDKYIDQLCAGLAPAPKK